MLSAANNISTSIRKDNSLNLRYIYELGILFYSNSKPNLFLKFCVLLRKHIEWAGSIFHSKKKLLPLVLSFSPNTFASSRPTLVEHFIYARHYPENFMCADSLFIVVMGIIILQMWIWGHRLNNSHKSSPIGNGTHAIWLQSQAPYHYAL